MLGCYLEQESPQHHYESPGILTFLPLLFTLQSVTGIIIAGGIRQNSVKLFKPETNEVCDLPNTPDRFYDHSLDLVDDSLIMCGSFHPSLGRARMK